MCTYCIVTTIVEESADEDQNTGYTEVVSEFKARVNEFQEDELDLQSEDEVTIEHEDTKL